MKKRVLVCGSSGFIGRNIVERLVQRNDLEVCGTHCSRPAPKISGLKPLRVDLTIPEQVRNAMFGADIVIQAAANTSGSKDIFDKPYVHVTDNAVMNSLIFRAAHDLAISHVIFFSCSIMYKSSEKPIKESDFDANLVINSRYFGAAWTKVYIEKQCEFYSRLGITKYTVIRHSNIYGPYDKFDLERSHVLGATINKAISCRDGKLSVWGPGTERRDLLYVEDLVDFVEKALEIQTYEFELINVGSGHSIAINDLVKKIVAAADKDIVAVNDLGKPSIPTRVCLDISRAREVFGWVPSTGLQEGIRKTVSWYKSRVESQT